ncbi:Sulfatase [Planctomycetes bacterium Poly30]|uniref:Sulfatase n=1 Tax=Saltatorellus ferox TaxID=2528018 RepID=A0A518EXT7_9BACT|nr:Sulfatase [Planctomycetes bacterium Poly30]
MRGALGQWRLVASVLLLAGGVLPACGGSSDSKGAAQGSALGSALGVEPWGLADTGQDQPSGAVDFGACDTVIVIALDKVMRSEWIDRAGAVATPHIESIVAGAMKVADAIVTSTAGNAALASLLTGRHVTEHGIVSLRDTARQTLPESERTLAMGFHDLGWTTIFSSGSPLHARGFSGFDRGFDHYEAPRLSEESRLAAATGNGALVPLRAALAAQKPVFALVCFDDLTARALRAPSPEATVPFVRARLGPLARERADIEAGLRSLDVDPAKALADLAQLLARARGSEASSAWNMALRDAYLSLIDDAVGEILNAVEAAGRAERALVVVTGLRGTLPPGYRHESGALFTADAIRLPMVIRWPGGVGRGEIVEETASLLDLPHALDDAFGLDLGETAYRAADLSVAPGPALPGNALVVESQRQLFAAVGGDMHVERYSNGHVVVFDREGGKARQADEARVAQFTEELQDFVDEATALRVTFSLRDPDPRLDMEMAWETGDGAVLQPGEDRPAVRGKVEFPGADGGRREAALALTERDTALRIRLRTPGREILDPPGSLPPTLGPRSVRLGTSSGSTSLANLPVMFAPLDDVGPRAQPDASPEEAPPARLRFERADGLYWTLFVDAGPEGAGPQGPDAQGSGDGGAETEVLLSVWPPRHVSDALEVRAGGGTRSEPVPGRLDMVRIHGVAPLVCRVKKLAKEDFLVACWTPEGFLAPTEMEFHGLRLADRQAFEFTLLHWQPAASAALPSLDPALFRAGGDAGGDVAASPDGGPSFLIERVEFGPLPTLFSPPDASDAAELVRLSPGE